MRPLLFSILAVLPGMALAQNELTGDHQFPEFRTLSALPGGGFGVLPNGAPSIRGAMAISSPIAHVLSRQHLAIGLSNTSFRGSFRFYRDRNGLADGTGWAMLGMSSYLGSLTASAMLLSTRQDTVMNFEYAPPGQQGPIRYAVGVQDAFNEGGTSGETLDNLRGGGNSRSFFGVATYQIREGAFLTLGTGSQRFKGVFGSASYNFCRRATATLEYDAFNWNYGASIDLGGVSVWGKDVRAALFLGQIRGKYWTWGLNVGF